MTPHFRAGVRALGRRLEQPTPRRRPGRPTTRSWLPAPPHSTYPASAPRAPGRRVALPGPHPGAAAQGHSCPCRWEQGRGTCVDGQVQEGGTKRYKRPVGQNQRWHPEVTEAEGHGLGARDRGCSPAGPPPFCLHPPQP